jgi:4'-phosphopantetheinyl transferase
MQPPRPDELLIVLADLDVPEARREAMLSTFNTRELARYRAFRHDEHRHRWGASRGQLREILGAVLGVAPVDVAFTYGAHGKPALAGSALRFNLSHSGPLAMVAIAHVEVGADVELPRRRRSDDIARRFFTAGENERLFAIPDAAAREDAFFRLWTCKEAFLKCTGEGLSRSTRSFEIELSDGRARLLWAKGVDAARYSIHPVETRTACRAAVVAEGVGLAPMVRSWP